MFDQRVLDKINERSSAMLELVNALDKMKSGNLDVPDSSISLEKCNRISKEVRDLVNNDEKLMSLYQHLSTTIKAEKYELSDKLKKEIDEYETKTKK